MSQSRIRRYGEERSTVVRNPEPRQDEVDIRRYPEPRLAHESRHNTGKHIDRRYIQEQSLSIERSAEESVLSRERGFLPAAGYGTDLVSDYRSRSPAEYSAERQQVRFDPFTGEPYKFDPFTGEPIRPEPSQRRSGSLYWLEWLKQHWTCQIRTCSWNKARSGYALLICQVPQCAVRSWVPEPVQ